MYLGAHRLLTVSMAAIKSVVKLHEAKIRRGQGNEETKLKKCCKQYVQIPKRTFVRQEKQGNPLNATEERDSQVFSFSVNSGRAAYPAFSTHMVQCRRPGGVDKCGRGIIEASSRVLSTPTRRLLPTQDLVLGSPSSGVPQTFSERDSNFKTRLKSQ